MELKNFLSTQTMAGRSFTDIIMNQLSLKPKIDQLVTIEANLGSILYRVIHLKSCYPGEYAFLYFSSKVGCVVQKKIF